VVLPKLPREARLLAYKASQARRIMARTSKNGNLSGAKAKDPLQSMRAGVQASFRFVVDIADVAQGVFTECTLPNIDWEIQEVKEGGLNSYLHELPGRRKSARISLKNGLGTSELVNWYLQSMNEQFVRRTVTIKLLDSLHEPVMIWNVADAYPIKWVGPQLKSDTGAVAIQTLELVCGQVTVELVG
jgi:phage tail-like protein